MLCASFFILQSLFLVSQGWAQTLTGRAPSQVAVGEQFRLTYTVNSHDVSGFRAGSIPDALEVLMGPSTSSQSSFQMVNGHTSHTSSITYTYILVANKNGTFTIPPARISVGGKTVESNELRITVYGQQQQGQQSGARGGQPGGMRGRQDVRSSGTNISGSDLFFKVSASKRKVYEQEPILLTYKVYTRVDLARLNNNMPDLKNFYTREIPLPQQKHFEVEMFNGMPYRTVVWNQYVMYPQRAGKLEIPSIAYEGLVQIPNRNIDPFEAFFNGGSAYTEVKKKIMAPGLTIEVEPLPSRPVGFSGGVGSFSLSAKLDTNAVKANDPIKLQLVVSGSGNMKLLKKPEVRFPKDFETYNVKVKDKTRLTNSGLEGSIVYDYLAVPRHQGEYVIPSVEYTYFDLRSGEYKTLTTDSFAIHVARGSGSQYDVSSYTSQEDIKLLNSDIRYIKTGKARLHAIDDFFFGEAAYLTTLGVLLLAFVSLFVIFRRRAIDNADLVKQRAGKASKVAAKRLRKASRLMKAGNDSEFYDEVLRALWGFVGDRLNIPVEQLSRENISQQLEQHNVSADVVSLFIGAIDECEYARYAPGDATGNMNKVYEAAMTAITNIAMTMRKGKKVKG
ncbi:MAG: protein BatD [Prevotella sp.]|nr:protein BatD [Prevotella sp.]